MNFSKLRYLLFDVDGVLSDGKISYTNTADEIKNFHVRDGMGLSLAKKAGFKLGIITARESNIVYKRASELNFDDLFMNQKDKTEAYEVLKTKHRLDDEEVAYIGDDLIDLPILTQCAFSACPSDAHNFVQEHVDIVLKHSGGNGAVREFIDHILNKQGKLKELEESYLTRNK